MQTFVSSWFSARPQVAVRSARTQAQSTSTVLVSGAGGKTGKLVAAKVKALESYKLRALCRTEESKSKVQSELQLEDSECVVADVVNSDLTEAMQGCSALIVATSATPKIDYFSMPGFFWKKFVMKEKAMPGFTFPQMPEVVDWEGQKKQIDAAKAAGVEHVVLVSSMGGTQPENTLNKIGAGDILVWKRKAEMYLMASGLAYTIIHPGGLADSEGGQEGIEFGVDDKLLERDPRRISRADVAEICVQSLSIAEARNRSIDCINVAASEAPSTLAAFSALFSGMKNNCDYSINPPPA